MNLEDQVLAVLVSGGKKAVAHKLAHCTTKDIDAALWRAAFVNNAHAVELLMEHASGEGQSEALCVAATSGHTAVVRSLVAVADGTLNDSFALWEAVKKGHTDVVRLLIPVSDPTAQNQAALRLAVQGGHWGCVEVLYPVSNAQQAVEQFAEFQKKIGPGNRQR